MKLNLLVEKILERYPRCRNSDSDLIIAVLSARGMWLNDGDREIIRSVNFDSITRERRGFQEIGKFLPTDPEVRKKRRLKEAEIQQTAPSLSPNKLQEKMEARW